MRCCIYANASAQNCLPNPALDSIQQTFSSRAPFMHSYTLFCCGVPLIVKCWTMSCVLQMLKNGSLLYSPPLSVLSFLIFLLVWFSTICFHLRKTANTSSFVFKLYTQTLLEKQSTKSNKVMLTF